MRKLRAQFLRLAGLFNRRHRAGEFADELESNLQMHIEENLRAGMSPDEARYAALRKFGNVARVKEDAWELWSFVWIEQLWQDVRFGLRMIAKKPGFSVVVVLSLALGIGANTAIFSLVDAVLLRALPVQRPDELVVLSLTGRGTVDYLPFPVYQELRTRSHLISGMLASFDADGTLRVSVNSSGSGARAELTRAQLVSGTYYSVLGVNAICGRTITPDDDKVLGGHPVAVISHGFWERRFGRDPSVVGKTITLNGQPFTIIGVTPREFFGITPGHPPDVTVPLMMQAQIWLEPGQSMISDKNSGWLRLMARLNPNVPEGEARTELTTLLRQIQIEFAGSTLSPEDRRAILHRNVEFEPASKGLNSLRREFSKPLLVLFSLVGLVLLIACANVAVLLLSRAVGRGREIAVRLGLGAPRLRLVRQLLTESVLLSVIGGAFGWLLAYWLRNALLSLLIGSAFPVSVNAPLDSQVLCFALALSLLTGILFGVAPALRSTSAQTVPGLVRGPMFSESTGRLPRWSFGNFLVSFQVGLSLLLLVAAGLFLRSLQKLGAADTGFNRKNLLLVSVDSTMIGYKDTDVLNLYQQLLTRLASLPGVESAALSSHSLISAGIDDSPFVVPGHVVSPGEPRGVNLNFISPQFFRTMGVSILIGREFQSRDNPNGHPVAIISDAVANQYFGNQNPVGKTFIWGGQLGNTPIEIIGVAKDVKWDNIRNERARIVYLPFQQRPAWHDPLGQVTFEIRTERAALSTAAAVRKQVRQVEKNLPVFDVITQEQQVEDSLTQEHAVAALSTSFGLIGLLLAVLGLYGTMSNHVLRRTHEIGVRMALGARHSDVLRMVFRESQALVLLGTVAGLAAAWGATRFVSSMLYNLKPTDPATIAIAALLMAAASGLAGAVPARRAIKVDPMVALRYE